MLHFRHMMLVFTSLGAQSVFLVSLLSVRDVEFGSGLCMSLINPAVLALFNKRHHHGFPELLQENPPLECLLLIPAWIHLHPHHNSIVGGHICVEKHHQGHRAVILLHEYVPVTIKQSNTEYMQVIFHVLHIEMSLIIHHIEKHI